MHAQEKSREQSMKTDEKLQKHGIRRLVIKRLKNSITIAYVTPENQQKRTNKRFVLPEQVRTKIQHSPGVFELEPLPRNGIVYCTLLNGERIQPNDFVFVSSPFAGEPFQIARIMSFEKSESCLGTNLYDSVRLNWFFRPRDIQRNSSDTRLLYASMHSDIYNIGFIQELVSVKHKTEIHNFDEYTRQPKSFHYDRLFDQNINKVFDLLPVHNITNLPKHTLFQLQNNYDFAIVELGKGRALMEAPRLCNVCDEWCSLDFSVQCADCKRHYHMKCVHPPLVKKPPHGFGWTCALCSVSHRQKKSSLRNSATLMTPSESQPIETSVSSVKEDTDTNDETNNSDMHTPSNFSSMATPDNHIEKDDTLSSSTEVVVSPLESVPGSSFSKLRRLPWNMRYIDLRSDFDDESESDLYPSRVRSATSPGFSSTVELHSKAPRLLTTADEEIDQNVRSLENAKSDLPSFFAKWPFLKNIHLKGFLFPFFEPSLRGGMLLVPLELDDSDLDDYLRKSWNQWKNLKIAISPFVLLDVSMAFLYQNELNMTNALDNLQRLITGSDFPNVESLQIDEKRFGELVKAYGGSLHVIHRSLEARCSLKELLQFYLAWSISAKGTAILKDFAATKEREGSWEEKFTLFSNYELYDPSKLLRYKKPMVCRNCQSRKSSEWFVGPGTDNTNKDKNKLVIFCERCGIIWKYYATTSQKALGVEFGRSTEKVVKRRILEWEQLFANIHNIGNSHHTRDDSPGVSPSLTIDSHKANNVKSASESSPRLQSPLNRNPRNGTSKIKVEASLPALITKKECNLCGGNNYDDLIGCHRCGLIVHTSCQGLKKGADDQPKLMSMISTSRSTRSAANNNTKSHHSIESTQWLCESCTFVTKFGLDSTPECLLCCQTDPQLSMKRTVEGNWVHMLCAAWTPGVIISNDESEPVLGIGSLPSDVWANTCEICQLGRGVVVSCHNNNASLAHISCALKSGWNLCFDLIRRDTPKYNIEIGMSTLSFFNSYSVTSNEADLSPYLSLKPVVFRGHANIPRNLIPRTSTIPSLGKNSWKAYLESMNSKHAFYFLQAAQTYTPLEEQQLFEESCSKCSTTMSPYWWPGGLCHMCYFHRSPESELPITNV
ncbi:Lid2 complex subunit Snt2 [Schizosaccharomyces cryophilus OY26]|uniref:Lid2 complex subunit Snt2 n=1 Tax=Schizosaccharomyces cryophilus (strain OY26 / ATCC MYA-4695 / CBS 11777 / NBRC 106824 / NRRL Y48691) TaxID=653667 RepID=S9VZ05_SCHCR|nr:Lid2 complex subunit Snt2 [Schizosaccharomyces cryophilus OY26]EPY52828.1 Lid2 complex subunit Snt2 [Schizosaccharomyces cryophilus OY26]